MSRLNFSIKTQRGALKRSGGTCECHLIPHVFTVACGRQLGPGNTFYEHINPDGLRPDNSIDNCAALTRTCWKFKTETFDQGIVAKAKRVNDRHNGIQDPWRRRLPGGKHDTRKKTLTGRVINRHPDGVTVRD